MKLHKSITRERIVAGARESMFGMSDDGVCITCGQEQHGVEPDAERYPCEGCGTPTVYGWEQIMLRTIA